MASSSSSHKLPSRNLMIRLIFCFSSFLHPTESAAVKATRRAISASSTTVAQLLSAHNAVRARHYIPPLKWSNKLADCAKWYANQRRNDCALVHSSADYGENIFWGQGSRWKTTDAVASWAAQEAYYNYEKNTCMPNKDCLHYTQLVWRATTQVGCARIKCRSGDTYVVCEYYPHGNAIGERPY